MADIELIKGADNGNPPDSLRQMYPKVNRNFQNLNAESKANADNLEQHKNTTAAHDAPNISYSGQVPGSNVKVAIENINGRISEIVAQSGDDITEIVDARGRFPVLGERLNALDSNIQDIVYNVKTFSSIESVFEDVKAGGGGTVYLPPGTYKVNNTISVSDIPNLTIMALNNVVITTDTVDLDFMFTFLNCPNLRISGIDFDNNFIGKSIIKIEDSPNFIIENNLFQNFKEDPVDIYRHALYFTRSPYGIILNNKFRNIGKSFGGSAETTGTQYRSISANSGCDRLTIQNNEFSDAFQGLVVGEFPFYSSAGITYTTSSRVLYNTGTQINQYRSLQDHTSSIDHPPTDTSYWALEYSDIRPIEDIIFANNYLQNIRDNGIYFLEYVKQIIIDGNTFTNCHDEPLAIIGENALITNNVFRNIQNKAIAIGDKQDIESIVVTNNIFDNNANYLGNFVAYRGASPSTVTLKKLIIENNTFRTLAALGNASHFSLPKTDYLSINNNIIDTQSDANQVVIRTWGDVIKGQIVNNIITSISTDSLYYRDSATSNITLSGNKTNGRAMANGANILLQNVRYDLSPSNVYARESNSRWGFGSGVPAAGTWNRGDIIFNTAANAGGNAGWICVTAGTPGTWKTFGTISN